MLDATKRFFAAILICGWMIAFQYAAEVMITKFAR